MGKTKQGPFNDRIALMVGPDGCPSRTADDELPDAMVEITSWAPNVGTALMSFIGDYPKQESRLAEAIGLLTERRALDLQHLKKQRLPPEQHTRAMGKIQGLSIAEGILCDLLFSDDVR